MKNVFQSAIMIASVLVCAVAESEDKLISVVSTAKICPAAALDAGSS